MTALIVDAGALYAQADADEPQHAAVAQVLRDEGGPAAGRVVRAVAGRRVSEGT